MRLIYTRDGFSKNEKEEWRLIIFQNIIDGLRRIVDAMDEFNIPFEFENTTVRILSSHLRLGGRRDPDPLLFMLTCPVPSPGPPPNDHGRQRPPAIRTHTTPIRPRF
jgi:guanine nucleotide-binding protein subunit alpha